MLIIKQKKEVEKMEQKRMQKNSKGITLIALVITIIVLLILAGVTIATLTGENGILNQANQAKIKSDIAEVKEQAQLDIANWTAEKLKNGEDTTLTDEKVKEIIENNSNKYYSNLTDTSIITKQGNEILFSDLYTKTTPTFNPETLTIGEAKNTGKYGWKVTNYTVTTNEFTTGVWRLFYQDNNYAYLITDECVGSYTPSSQYSDYTEVGMVGQKLNPKVSSLFTNTDWPNVKTTAWLTDTSATSPWNSYKNDDAVFAIRKSNSRIICSIL